MKVHQVVDRALKDPSYAQTLRDKALAADRGGPSSNAWRDPFGEFTHDPRELSRMAPQRTSRWPHTTTATVATTATTVTITGGPTVITTTTLTLTTTITTVTLTRGPEVPDDPDDSAPDEGPVEDGQPDAPRA